MIIVEIRPDSGAAVEVTLDFDFGAGKLSDGSWSCLPGRLSLSNGYFKISRFDDLWLLDFDDSPGLWDTVRYIFGGDMDKAKTAAVLRDFGDFWDLANGHTGKGTAYLATGRLDFATWRIKSGAKNTKLTQVVRQPVGRP